MGGVGKNQRMALPADRHRATECPTGIHEADALVDCHPDEVISDLQRPVKDDVLQRRIAHHDGETPIRNDSGIAYVACQQSDVEFTAWTERDRPVLTVELTIEYGRGALVHDAAKWLEREWAALQYQSGSEPQRDDPGIPHLWTDAAVIDLQDRRTGHPNLATGRVDERAGPWTDLEGLPIADEDRALVGKARRRNDVE